ncbi:uncharacterized protein ATNIH1004_002112 [Aspergillus tanneri]|uniref:Uncharacterized protein n=1 Tax=Aspergillus tanneri TaxID=1220188 RepID=A0A5M9MQP6_9EURO|nr:uncharacterized protein ATNIH1004_002112 [Aspergillus tanneri]KAA8649441.1 hypothetical protein ATNIH1004_002112 [Aspergillus tanneri]
MSDIYIPPRNISFRLLGLGSQCVLFSRTSRDPGFGYHTKNDVLRIVGGISYQDRGNSQGTTDFKVKTPERTFTRRAARQEHDNLDQVYYDQWFKPDSVHPDGCFRLRNYDNGTVLVSGTAPP